MQIVVKWSNESIIMLIGYEWVPAASVARVTGVESIKNRLNKMARAGLLETKPAVRRRGDRGRARTLYRVTARGEAYANMRNMFFVRVYDDKGAETRVEVDIGNHESLAQARKRLAEDYNAEAIFRLFYFDSNGLPAASGLTLLAGREDTDTERLVRELLQLIVNKTHVNAIDTVEYSSVCLDEEMVAAVATLNQVFKTSKTVEIPSVLRSALNVQNRICQD